MSRPRPVRLTVAEYSALVEALAVAGGEWEDYDDPQHGGPAGERKIAAGDRALAKIEAVLTTPAIRRDALIR